MSIAKEFAAGAGDVVSVGAATGAARAALWEAFGENTAAVTAGALPRGGAAMAADAAPQSFLEAIAGFATGDRQIQQQIEDRVAPQTHVPTYNEVAKQITDVKVENLQHISAPAADKIDTAVPTNRNANDYALRTTDQKLAQVAEIEQNLNKIGDAEAAGRPPAQGNEQEAAATQAQEQNGLGVGALARGVVVGGAAAGIATAVGGPVAGAIAGGIMTALDFRAAANAMTGGANPQHNGQGSFGAKTEGTLGEFRRVSKAEARNESLRAEGSAPAAHSMDRAAQAAPGALMPAEPQRGLGDIAMAGDSLAGVKKAQFQESPQLTAMRDSVKGIREELEQQNDRARTLDGDFGHRQMAGVTVDAKGAMDAMNRGMDVNLAASQRAFVVSGMSA